MDIECHGKLSADAVDISHPNSSRYSKAQVLGLFKSVDREGHCKQAADTDVDYAKLCDHEPPHDPRGFPRWFRWDVLYSAMKLRFTRFKKPEEKLCMEISELCVTGTESAPSSSSSEVGIPSALDSEPSPTLLRLPELSSFPRLNELPSSLLMSCYSEEQVRGLSKRTWVDMEGNCKYTADVAVDGAKLYVPIPTAVEISESQVTATESSPSSSSEVGTKARASSSKAISAVFNHAISSRIIPRTMQPRLGGGTTGVSSRIDRLLQVRSAYGSAVEFEIEASKVHWSELSDATSDDEEEGKVTDLEFFKSLQKKWGQLFFRDCTTLGLEVEGKIAEGGQAEIFNASYCDGRDRQRCVMKVFKEGYRLRDLQKQWPLGMLQNRSDYVNSCKILGANFLENGRFAFRMERYEGDLRKLIDSRMQQNGNQSPPFTEKEARLIMLDIAVGMESLHRHKIIHRDLKASNVFIHWREKNAFHPVHNPFVCIVGDFECSVGVVGTGYWRAPEILQAVQACDIRSHLFSEKSDVYSFAMTCYEVLTGCIPFENFSGICYDPVIQGKRPKLPRHVNPMLKTLVERCWHGNPLERPSFSDMVEELR